MASDKRFVESHHSNQLILSLNLKVMSTHAVTLQARSAIRETCGVQNKSLDTITRKFNAIFLGITSHYQKCNRLELEQVLLRRNTITSTSFLSCCEYHAIVFPFQRSSGRALGNMRTWQHLVDVQTSYYS